MTHPHYLGWQIDWPLFVKTPFTADGEEWERGEHFNWLNRGIDPSAVSRLYDTGFLYHNTDLEVETKVGDRLNEMTTAQLDRLVTLLNAEVKSRTNSVTEYTAKKCKQSKIDDKQRGLVRSFLRNNRWIEDKFYEIRDNILDAQE
jgi:uncharacterized protein involved in exopolysaccharide biosynthesis